jgi:hypothetical protein
MLSLYDLRTAASRPPNLARSMLSLVMRRCFSPRHPVAHCRDLHRPAVPDPNCAMNVEPSRSSAQRGPGVPVWAFATQSWFAGVRHPAGADGIIPVPGTPGEDRPAVPVARPRDPPTRHQPGDDRGKRLALPRSDGSWAAGRRSTWAVFWLSDQYHRNPMVATACPCDLSRILARKASVILIK